MKAKIIVAVIGLFCAVSASAFDFKPKYTEAGDPMAGTPTNVVPNGVYFIGVHTLEDGKALASFGSAIPLGTDLPLVSYSYINLGRTDVLSTGLAYMFAPVGRFSYGLIAGSDANWLDLPGDVDKVFVVQGAVGGVFGYGISEGFGLGGFAKYVTDFDSNNINQSGTAYGVAAWFGWGEN